MLLRRRRQTQGSDCTRYNVMNLKKMLAALLFPVAISLGAQTAPALPQIVTPAKYPALSHSERQYYVAGIIDTDRLLFQQTKPLFAARLAGSTLEQMTGIVDRELGALSPELRSSMPIAAISNPFVTCCVISIKTWGRSITGGLMTRSPYSGRDNWRSMRGRSHSRADDCLRRAC